MEKNGVKGPFEGDLVLLNARPSRDNNKGKSLQATRVTLLMRNNTQYLASLPDSSKAQLELLPSMPPSSRREYECKITHARPKFSFADKNIFISHNVRDSSHVKGLWVGDEVKVDAIFNAAKRSWVATNVLLLRRDNEGYHAKMKVHVQAKEGGAGEASGQMSGEVLVPPKHTDNEMPGTSRTKKKEKKEKKQKRSVAVTSDEEGLVHDLEKEEEETSKTRSRSEKSKSKSSNSKKSRIEVDSGARGNKVLKGRGKRKSKETEEKDQH